jgi:hypothetical protein
VALKSEAETGLERAWAEHRAAVEAVPEEDASRPGVVEEWSVKDTMGHIAFWAHRAAETLAAVNAGRPEDIPRGEGPNWVDEWNDREYQARRDRAYSETRGDWVTAHEAARSALASTPEARLEEEHGTGKIIAYFAGDTYEHYDEHTRQIRAWWRQFETSEA